ncbi:FAD-dependent monooxygenase [Pseudonocardia sp. DSM 110487]|uniref:FAD-dependent oxidoreductase n=1 Tax=Pseudonocardia sp. DSM 110487 TaxID=2865833 RepID=UPI001C6A17ED|nr:FAD-dependent monooxygenase [Pseudonocardia sp. DSM 110487]QYN36625.1 FAD-dependent monooxygenase [Pseudonocardia sp. DSM 110487]
MRVLIIGGGIGGLALAQGLRRAGVDVAVHERDHGVGSRWEGYRIHINPTGARALHALLPTDGWHEFLATAGPGGDFGFLTEQLHELVVVEESIMYPGATDPVESHYAADRATLRRVLSSGLDDVVRLGSEFVGYELQPDGQVEARFSDGSTDLADLLVGADGPSSRVRAQLLPHAAPVDAAVVGIANKIWLDGATRAELGRLGTGMNAVQPSAPVFLFTSVFEPPAATGLRPYLLCALVARPELLPPDVTELDSDALRAVVDVLVAGWHPRLRRALASADPSARSAVTFSASPPVPTWTSGPVTVLGDAIHVMPPIGGLGGNTALRDAHLLSRLLPAVDRGERALPGAVAEYEAEMREYGTAAVHYAVEQARQLLSSGPGAMAAARTFFRLCAAVGPLRRRAFANGWAAPAAARAWERGTVPTAA